MASAAARQGPEAHNPRTRQQLAAPPVVAQPAGANVDDPPGVVQLSVRLVAAPDRADDILRTLLRAVVRPAQQLAGCRFAQVYQRVGDPRLIDYIEEWDDMATFRPHLSCERFSRLLELIEMAAEAPEVEFRCISETHGIGYVATQRAMRAVHDSEPDDH